jgi:adenylyltransferase/sulfurtransferase
MEGLTDYDLKRYHRQMLIRGWGEDGQRKLKSARVFVAGAGGLGSPVAIYLAVAGVGEIRICDSDSLELSNLNRQILHSDERVGELKAISAQKTLSRLNPSIRVVGLTERMNESSIDRLAGQADIVVDCLDNFETRYVLNAYCIRCGIPLVHGAIWGMTGQVTFLKPPETPCLKCVFPEAPPKEVFPVVGVTPGLTGCIQAMEVLKYLTGTGSNLRGRLLLIEGEDMSCSVLNVRRSDACPACGGAGCTEGAGR